MINNSAKLDKKNVVALLGPRGSFSDSAKLEILAEKKLKAKITKIYKKTFGEIFAFVARSPKGRVGLAPVYNKLVGKIAEVAEKMESGEFEVLGIFKLKVSMVLAAKKGVRVSDIKRIYVSKIVYGQCEKFIKKRFPKAKIFSGFDGSSEAFKKVVQLKGIRAKESAAIGSEDAAKIYKLSVIAKNIQDKKDDSTTFVLFQRSTLA